MYKSISFIIRINKDTFHMIIKIMPGKEKWMFVTAYCQGSENKDKIIWKQGNVLEIIK